ncbi:MAG: UDP-N-acetylmuramoyl-L-alanyl-D-glutamate--2,6-diaminopimelate ligase [Candidatus Levyibacteriota bacterium]|jgi:UDP-N-acetylmuramoyl-L-alanyl-D-glutamate--2,6-diaminopimelate ligase
MEMTWRKIKNFYHLCVAFVVNVIFLFPAKEMEIIAVTGTDGKTTTVNLIYHILQSAGHKVSMVSSIGAVINGKTYDTGAHVTTPSPVALQKLLKKAKDSRSEYFILEVTSHAIDQNRIFGIPVRVAVLTNITNEHLDYHKTFNNYLCTKLELIEKAQLGIVNRDDNSYALLVRNKKGTENWKTYGLTKETDYNPQVLDISDCKLLGNFNKYNTLAAAAVAKEIGISDAALKVALKSFQMPIGRADYVYKRNFSVMVDFAHTPNAFEELLKTLRPITKARIIHIFGSAGERDKDKRPIMGKTSARYADVIILTAEDPRTEDVNSIIEQIAKGINNRKTVFKIPDRREAIYKGIELAGKGDLVLITGKAQESSMNYGHGEEEWDEFAVVEDALENKKNAKN